jgi:hypothetical protein
MTERAHSRIGASSMYRWRACPGSVRLSEGMPNNSTVYAAEGSVAHAWAEYKLSALLTGAFQAPLYKLGDKVVHDGHEIEITEEMETAVDFYVATIWEHASRPGCTLRIEQRLDLSSIHPGMFGTSDAVVIEPESKKVTVYDLKFGAGIAVDAEDNEQMQFYAVGTLLGVSTGVSTIEVVIVQPRAFHPLGPVRRWSFPAVEIFDFIADMKAAAVATEDPNAPFAAGDHCRFCPAQPVCETLKDYNLKIAQTEFPPIEGTVIDGKPAPQPKYDPAKLNEVLRALPVIESWMNSVKAFARAEALAGRGSDGHKLVRGRGSREVVDENGLKVWLVLDQGIDEKALYHPPKFKSPNQIEELRGPDGKKLLDAKAKKEMNSLHIRAVPGGLVLVPAEDARPAVVPGSEAQSEFAAVAVPE